MSERVEFSDTELDCLAWYWQAAKNNPIKSGTFVHRSAPVPMTCRWCGRATVYSGAVTCEVCDAPDRSVEL